MTNAPQPANGEAVPACPDAELVRLGAELVRLGAVLDAAWVVQDEIDRTEPEGPACDEAYARCKAIVERIILMPAATIAGLRVKVRAVSWCHSGDPFGDESFGDTTDLRMVSSILRDILGADPRT